MTDRRELTILACGHASADFCQGAVPALVPFLVLRGGIDFKATGVLLLVMSIASSLLQPLIGARADRHSMAWAVPVGVALGGVGIAAVGVVDGFVSRMVAVTSPASAWRSFIRAAPVSPPAPPLSGQAAAWACSPSAGVSASRSRPALLTPSVLAFGLNGTLVALIPALTVAALLTTTRDAPPKATSQAADSGLPGHFWLLMSVASLRAGAYYGLQTLSRRCADRPSRSRHRHRQRRARRSCCVAGGFGTYLGGRLADRYGYERVLTIALALTLPAVALIELSPSPALALPAAALARHGRRRRLHLDRRPRPAACFRAERLSRPA